MHCVGGHNLFRSDFRTATYACFFKELFPMNYLYFLRNRSVDIFVSMSVIIFHCNSLITERYVCKSMTLVAFIKKE